MVFINFLKNVVKVTLICLMLVSVFSGSNLVTVKSPPTPYFSIESTLTNNPHWGYYGGYHDIWAQIDIELAKIGIDLTQSYSDDFEWWDQVWEEGWNYSASNPFLTIWCPRLGLIYILG